jgi:hypothetical protein
VRWIIYLLVLLTLSIAVSAGCFTNSDSAFYCQDVAIEQAEDECEAIGCFVDEDFFEESCNQLTQCDDIICKSSCIETKKGECLAGEIPLGEETLWCSEGCCMFNYLDDNFCDFTKTKWLCEAEAKNKRASSIVFESNSKFGCLEICQQALPDRKLYLQGKNLELISSTASLFKNEVKKPVVLEVTKEVVEKKDQTDTDSGIFLYFMLLVLSIGIVVIFVHKYHFFTQSTVGIPKEGSKLSDLLVPKKESEDRILEIKKEHNHKSRKRQRESYFTQQGFPIVKEKPHFTKLHKMIKKREDLEKRKKEAPTIFSKLKNMSKKPKKKVDIIKELRKIVK